MGKETDRKVEKLLKQANRLLQKKRLILEKEYLKIKKEIAEKWKRIEKLKKQKRLKPFNPRQKQEEDRLFKEIQELLIRQQEINKWFSSIERSKSTT